MIEKLGKMRHGYLDEIEKQRSKNVVLAKESSNNEIRQILISENRFQSNYKINGVDSIHVPFGSSRKQSPVCTLPNTALKSLKTSKKSTEDQGYYEQNF